MRVHATITVEYDLQQDWYNNTNDSGEVQEVDSKFVEEIFHDNPLGDNQKITFTVVCPTQK